MGVLFSRTGNRHRAGKKSIKIELLLESLSSLERLLLLVALTLLLALVWKIAAEPITDYDSVWYHLPAIAQWYQSGTFSFPDWLKTDQTGRYPYDWEVLYSMFLLPVGDDSLIMLPNVIIWCFLGLSMYCTSIRLGARRDMSLSCAVLVLACPAVLRQVNTARVDLALAAFIIASFYFLLAFATSATELNLLFFLVSLGMLLGIKTSGLVYGSCLLVLLLWVLVCKTYSRRSRADLSKLLTSAPVWFGCCLGALLGGFWYLKNWIELGNPIGYVAVRIGKVMLFPGVLKYSAIHTTSLAHMFNFGEARHWAVLLRCCNSEFGLSLLVIVLSIATGIVWRVISSARKDISTDFGRVGLLFLGLAILGFFFWNTPYSADNVHRNFPVIQGWIANPLRYAIGLFSYLGITSAVLVSNTPLSGRWIIGVATVIAGVVALDGVLHLHLLAQWRCLLLWLQDPASF